MVRIPPRVSLQPCRATGSGTGAAVTLGIQEIVKHLFEALLKVSSHKTIYRVNILLFTAVLLLLVNELWSTNYDEN